MLPLEVGLVHHDVFGGGYHLRKLPIYPLLQVSRGSFIIIQILKRIIRLLGFSLLELLERHLLAGQTGLVTHQLLIEEL